MKALNLVQLVVKLMQNMVKKKKKRKKKEVQLQPIATTKQVSSAMNVSWESVAFRAARTDTGPTGPRINLKKLAILFL